VLKIRRNKFPSDYGYHCAMDSTPSRNTELISKVRRFVVKIVHVYGANGCSRSDKQRRILMIGKPERYDYGTSSFIMRACRRRAKKFPRKPRRSACRFTARRGNHDGL